MMGRASTRAGAGPGANSRAGLGRRPPTAALAHELIFAPGLSTSPKVADLSGRGMGLDACARTWRG